jgi:hypothetical protein
MSAVRVVIEIEERDTRVETGRSWNAREVMQEPVI